MATFDFDLDLKTLVAKALGIALKKDIGYI